MKLSFDRKILSNLEFGLYCFSLGSIFKMFILIGDFFNVHWHT